MAESQGHGQSAGHARERPRLASSLAGKRDRSSAAPTNPGAPCARCVSAAPCCCDRPQPL
eukprot:157317-Prymnesium_polylepis.1